MKSTENSTDRLEKSKLHWLEIGLIVLAVGAIVVATLRALNKVPEVNNFDECAAAGYPIQESYPEICRTPDGRSFTQKVKSNSSGAEPVTAKDFRILVSEGRTAIKKPKNVVIANQQAWEALWKEAFSNITPLPNLIPVDFSKEMVIAAFAGEKSTGGFYNKIMSIDEGAAKITVNVLEVQRGKGCVVPQALSTPHYIVATEKSAKTIEFLVTKEVKDCTT